jgi:hypothetical protein
MHDPSHTAASILMAEGCQPKYVQEHRGHSSTVVAMGSYGHFYPEAKSEVASVFERAYAFASELTACGPRWIVLLPPGLAVRGVREKTLGTCRNAKGFLRSGGRI